MCVCAGRPKWRRARHWPTTSACGSAKVACQVKRNRPLRKNFLRVLTLHPPPIYSGRALRVRLRAVGVQRVRQAARHVAVACLAAERGYLTVNDDPMAIPLGASSDCVECDVLVVGSGASGLTAALSARQQGLDVIVIEKTDLVGGCSAYSLGMLWIPCNPVAARAGMSDHRAAALEYLRREMGERFDEAPITAYLDHAPHMLEFLESECGFKFEPRENFPDYHSDRPGARPAGRTLISPPFDARVLGKHLRRLRRPQNSVLGMTFSPAESKLIAARKPAGFSLLARRVLRQIADQAIYGRSTHLVGGSALVAWLFKATRARGVPVHTGVAMHELIMESGSVCGAWATSAGRSVRLLARRGVVLACGGFAHDRVRCAELFEHPPLDGLDWSLAPPSCDGDGIRHAVLHGGQFEPRGRNAAFWAPVSRLPGDSHVVSGHWHDRQRPGYLAVDSRGRRFANEGQSNHHFCEAMLRATPVGCAPQAWLLCDGRALGHIGLGDRIPGRPFPVRRHLRSGYLRRGKTLAELAAAIDVDASVLAGTIDRFNSDAYSGVDSEFGKGQTLFDRSMGMAGHLPNPCLRPLAKGPFYAVRITVAFMATLAGLKTDQAGRVLNAAGAAVPGLFAVGNDRANLFAGTCPGGGITLGPGLTFAHLTGLALAATPSVAVQQPAAVAAPMAEVAQETPV